MKRAKIKKVGDYWRVYSQGPIVAGGLGGFLVRWNDIGAVDEWGEALKLALSHVGLN